MTMYKGDAQNGCPTVITKTASNNSYHHARLSKLIANAAKANAHFKLEYLLNIIAERRCDLMMVDDNAHDDTLWKQSRSPKVEYNEDDDDDDNETTLLLQKSEPSHSTNGNAQIISNFDEDAFASLFSSKCKIKE